jgi:hypothetical protein
MSTNTVSGESRVKLLAPQKVVRSGGEMRPLEYPHLYQIRAGDWRISYAVEHNRLAILVLEVVAPEGVSSKDAVHEKIAGNTRIRLLDWSEDAPGAQTPPDEVGRKLKIKLLDKAPEFAEDEISSEPVARTSRIRLHAPAATRQGAGLTERKVTPLDSPSM